MNEEDKKFHIEVTKIGMRYGGYIAIAAALFAVGAEQLLQRNWLAGSVLLIVAIAFTCICTCSSRSKINKLKKNEIIQQNDVSCIKQFFSFWHCQTYNGIPKKL